MKSVRRKGVSWEMRGRERVCCPYEDVVSGPGTGSNAVGLCYRGRE